MMAQTARDWTAKIALVSFSLLLVGGGIEGGLRLLPEPNITSLQTPQAGRGFMRNDYAIQWIPRENTRQQRVDPYGRPFVLRINSTGQRGADLGPRLPAQRRILFIGDSFTMASSLSEQDTFVEQTGLLLKEALGPHIRTINGGVDGYNTFQQLAYYRYHGQLLEPDVVVLCFYVGNDFRDNAVGTQRGGDLNPVLIPKEVIDKYQKAPDPFLRAADHSLLRDPLSGAILAKPIWAWMESLQRQSLLLRLLGGRYARAKAKWTHDLWLLDLENRYYFYEIGSYQQRAHALIKRSHHLTLDGIAQLRAVVEASGAEFMVVILPSQNQVDTTHWQHTLSLLDVKEEDLGPLHRSQPNQMIGAFCAARQMTYLDLLAPFATDRPGDLYLGIVQDLHFSPAGHQVAATEIADFLLTQSAFLTDPAIDHFRHGVAQLHDGNLAEAEARLRASIEGKPNWPAAQVALGDLYRQTGRGDLSAATYRRALRLDPLSLKALDGLGQALLAEGDTGAAIAQYTEALEVRPGWLPFYEQLHNLYLSRGRRQEAEEISREFNTLVNASGRTKGYWAADYNFTAEVHHNKGDSNKAIEMYERALRVDAHNSGTWNNLGETLSKAGQAARAEEAFLRSASLAPEAPESYNNLGNIYSKSRQWNQAVAMYHKALERSDNKAPILSNLGDTYLDMGEWALAGETFEQALVLKPDNAIFHYYLGRVGRAAGDKQKAEASLRRAVQLDSTDARSYVELGELLADQMQLDGAMRSFQRALVINRRYSRAWYGMAQSSDRAGKEAAALRAYRTFLDLWPHNDARRSLAAARVQELEARQ